MPEKTLITQSEVLPRYWIQNTPPYEVDFLIQRENDIFPVEVKPCIRFSLDNLKLDGDVLNIPLFLADQAERRIGMALDRRRSPVFRAHPVVNHHSMLEGGEPYVPCTSRRRRPGTEHPGAWPERS